MMKTLDKLREPLNSGNRNFRKGCSKPVKPRNPYSDVLTYFRFAAYMAVLGEIGWNKVFQYWIEAIRAYEISIIGSMAGIASKQLEISPKKYYNI